MREKSGKLLLKKLIGADSAPGRWSHDCGLRKYPVQREAAIPLLSPSDAVLQRNELTLVLFSCRENSPLPALFLHCHPGWSQGRDGNWETLATNQPTNKP